MRDFDYEECTVTVIRHSMTFPVNWVDMQRLIHVATLDMRLERSPADDELWIEADDERIAVCHHKPVVS